MLAGALPQIQQQIDALFIDENGNVGIGTNQPAEKLDVNGTVKANKFEGDGSFLKVDGSESLKKALDMKVDTTGGNITGPLAISGNVGIGTSNPGAKLDVNGDIIATNVMLKVHEATCNGVKSYEITGLNGNVHKIYKIYFHGKVNTNEDVYLVVRPNNDSGNSYRSCVRWQGEASGDQNYNAGILLHRTHWNVNSDLSSEFTLFCESGRERFGHGHGLFWDTTSERTTLHTVMGRWKNTTENITSITISALNINGSESKGTFSGRFIVYALNAK